MPYQDQDSQPRFGTALATFTQTGTYSNTVQLNGRLVALYSDNFPSAPGTIDFRASWNPNGTGWPVRSADGAAGTAFKIQSFGSGTFYNFGVQPSITNGLAYLILQIGTAGTTGAAAGGTIVLVTERA